MNKNDENKGFNIECINCGSDDINIDFVEDVMFCNHCDNTADIIYYGKDIQDRTIDLRKQEGC